MQQPKIEVRARDERRRDEVCAKWSTVERGERERDWECMKHFEEEKKPDGKQNKGKAQENEERRKMRGEERNNWEVVFVTRICQNVEINSVEANQGSPTEEDQKDGCKHWWKSQREISAFPVILWWKAQMCFLYLTYVPILLRENPVGLLDLMDLVGSGWAVLILI